eukprot:scaffold116279_cov83-Phaeocystis_antarctica.AAC.1
MWRSSSDCSSAHVNNAAKASAEHAASQGSSTSIACGSESRRPICALWCSHCAWPRGVTDAVARDAAADQNSLPSLYFPLTTRTTNAYSES